MPPAPVFAVSDGTLVRLGNPFFITGSGRCGTTLLRRLILERTHSVSGDFIGNGRAALSGADKATIAASAGRTRLRMGDQPTGTVRQVLLAESPAWPPDG